MDVRPGEYLYYGFARGLHRVYNIRHMGSVEEEKKLKEVEVERLRNILKKFGVREKLNRVREQIWKEGEINGLLKGVEYQEQIKGSVVELRLHTSYPDLRSEWREGKVIKDIFYPQGRTTMSEFCVPSNSIAVLTVGAASVNSIEAAKAADDLDISEVGDHVYIAFRTITDEQWADVWLTKDAPSNGFYFNGFIRKMRINGVTDLGVSQFIDRNLLEFTNSEFLPNRARAQEKSKFYK